MALEFPNNPQLNDEYTSGATTWRWNGEAWVTLPPTTIDVIDIESNDLTVTGDTQVNNLNVTGSLQGVSLNDISDVTISSPANQDILQYNSITAKWVPGTVAAVGGFNGGTISNPLNVSNSTASTDSISGALRVTGGVGIQGDVFIGGALTVEDSDLEIKTGASLKIYNASNIGYIGLQTPVNANNTTFTLPGSDGSAGQFLKTNGDGTLEWASAAGAGGGTPPGGQNLQVQFNNNNTFAGNSAFTFDPAQPLLSTPEITILGDATVNGTTESTDSTDGSLRVLGGIGVAKQINVAGGTNSFTGGTNSTSINTGTIVVTGGIGVSGDVNVGSNVSADTDPTNAEHLTNKRYVDSNVLAFSIAFGA